MHICLLADLSIIFAYIICINSLDTQYTQLPPVNWYSVYYKRQQGNNYLRRYVAAEKPVDFKNKDRSPRDLSGRRVRTIRFKYGDERECGELWKANQICNGPLHPGTQYR